MAIIDADGNPKVQYTYDAWGKILSISGPMADTLGAVNPLTYRGYVYDAETDLYYLESRYYDPAVGRFINGDAFAATGQGLLGNNMFAYCGNNPEMFTDPSGQCPHDGKFYTSGPFEGQFEYNPSCALCAAHGEFFVQPPSGEPIDAHRDQTLLNAHIIYSYLIQHGFSSNSACAVLGNMHYESDGLDPSKHEDGSGDGYGLAQWDPASKYTNWAAVNGYSNNSIYGQLDFLLYSMQPGRGEWFASSYYPQYFLSCNNFMTSTDSVSFLTQVFCYSYERPSVLRMERRISYAQYWYDYFN